MKRLIKILASHLPRKLPIGLTSFNEWVDDLIVVSGLPNNETTRKVAATFILRLPPTVASIPLKRVARELIKVAANQVAIQAAGLDKQDGNKKVQRLTT